MRSKPAQKLDGEGLWNYALRVLGTRAHSLFELRGKLLKRAESAAVLDQTLAKLRDYGFADDQKFSETFASSRLQNEGFGRQRVLRDLRAKRVPDSVAGKAVEQTFASVDERQLIDQFLARKYRAKHLPDFLKEQKNLASAYRRLRLAGFGHGPAMEALKRHASPLEEWDPPDEDALASEPD